MHGSRVEAVRWLIGARSKEALTAEEKQRGLGIPVSPGQVESGG